MSAHPGGRQDGRPHLTAHSKTVSYAEMPTNLPSGAKVQVSGRFSWSLLLTKCRPGRQQSRPDPWR